ncbi:FkbM family methyltransferase [Skermanella pratensis]|uniref:FkbM family methyltransferase n=1 Tax=Skermanella pratensis TaxID=2233999 RepID=UPI001B3B9555|nr:FkbM family methyltransferase [Skermanella pratensis]
MTLRANSLLKAYGVLRSALIYRANPLRRRRSREFYGRFLGPGDLAFDIGAHLGDRVRAWRDLGARVVAVEPQPHLAAVLDRFHGHDPSVTLVPAALGAAPGSAELLINRRNPTLSTLSAEWAAEVAASPRFPGERWEERVTVEVTTLDALIAAHGVPRFCKIDVEGFERAVLDGLSRPIECLSFEFIPETPERALACLERLADLGPHRYNVALGEERRLLSGDWLDQGAIVDWLKSRRPADGSGDIYARHVPFRSS